MWDIFEDRIPVDGPIFYDPILTGPNFYGPNSGIPVLIGRPLIIMESSHINFVKINCSGHVVFGPFSFGPFIRRAVQFRAIHPVIILNEGFLFNILPQHKAMQARALLK